MAKLRLGWLLQDARGPFGGRQAGTSIYRQPDGELLVRPRRNTLGGAKNSPAMFKHQF
ncbi:unnamed protein product, partial [marine sediment metagenome]